MEPWADHPPAAVLIELLDPEGIHWNLVRLYIIGFNARFDNTRREIDDPLPTKRVVLRVPRSGRQHVRRSTSTCHPMAIQWAYFANCKAPDKPSSSSLRDPHARNAG